MATKKTNDVKKTAQTAAAETEKAVKKAAAEVKEAPKAAKKAVEKTAKKVEKEAKETVKKVEKEAKKVEKEAKETVKKVEKETKAAAKTAKKTAEKALVCACVKGLFFEYGDKQIDASSLAELAKESFKANGGKGAVKSLELYVKAEDNALYYVVNGKESGKVEL